MERDEPVRLDRAAGVATLTLNRPDRLNALDAGTAAALTARLAEVERDPETRALVLRGAGPAFMAGGDIRAFAELVTQPETARRAAVARVIADAHAAVRTLRRMPQPAVAAVHGACAGYGLSLALACDLVLAAEDAVFTLAYIQIGQSPDGGATFHLPRAVGAKRAAEIALLGDRFGAEDALRWGLVNRVVPADRLGAEAEALAHRLAAGPRAALTRTKALLNAATDRPLDAQLEAEAAAFADGALDPDFAEGVAAFLAKRRPSFDGH